MENLPHCPAVADILTSTPGNTELGDFSCNVFDTEETNGDGNNFLCCIDSGGFDPSNHNPFAYGFDCSDPVNTYTYGVPGCPMCIRDIDSATPQYDASNVLFCNDTFNEAFNEDGPSYFCNETLFEGTSLTYPGDRDAFFAAAPTAAPTA